MGYQEIMGYITLDDENKKPVIHVSSALSDIDFIFAITVLMGDLALHYNWNFEPGIGHRKSIGAMYAALAKPDDWLFCLSSKDDDRNRVLKDDMTFSTEFYNVF